MEELRLAFLVIGGIAIVGILAHGMWSVRKNSKETRRASLETSDWEDGFDDIEDVEVDEDVLIIDPQTDNSDDRKVEPSLGSSEQNYDDLGLGAVRIVSGASTTNSADKSTPVEANDKDAPQPAETNLSKDAAPLFNQDGAQPAHVSKPKIYSSVVTQPKPEYAAQQVNAMRSKTTTQADGEMHSIPEPPPFLLKTGESLNTPASSPAKNADVAAPKPSASKVSSETKPVDGGQPALSTETVSAAQRHEPIKKDASDSTDEPEKISLADQARNFVKRSKAETKSKTRKRREPKIGEDQMRIDFDEPQDTSSAPDSRAAVEDTRIDASEEAAPAQEVLVLNVRASDDNPIQGAALLPMLLTLGFKFGDQDIFHRHVNSNGKGPVLFSLANMLKPGVFDIDNLENFSTPGVSLFMMLPIEGDPHQVFNMMHNAARKIAEEFSAQVLDGRRSALTKQSLQQYVEKIREFERKRMIARQ